MVLRYANVGTRQSFDDLETGCVHQDSRVRSGAVRLRLNECKSDIPIWEVPIWKLRGVLLIKVWRRGPWGHDGHRVGCCRRKMFGDRMLLLSKRSESYHLSTNGVCLGRLVQRQSYRTNALSIQIGE